MTPSARPAKTTNALAERAQARPLATRLARVDDLPNETSASSTAREVERKFWRLFAQFHAAFADLSNASKREQWPELVDAQLAMLVSDFWAAGELLCEERSICVDTFSDFIMHTVPRFAALGTSLETLARQYIDGTLEN